MKVAPWRKFMLPAAVLAIALGGCGSTEDGGGDGSGDGADTGTGDGGGGGTDIGTDTPEPDVGTDTPEPDVGTDTDGGTDADAGPGCGDGVVDPDEECDDGNTDDGDGCAADCTFEGGRNCDTCATDDDCAGPAICYAVDAFDAVCSEPCETDDDCGDGYNCLEAFNDADESLGMFCLALDGCDALPEDCTDGVDNDGDGDVDCDDSDCDLDPACVIADLEICNDDLDNDGDGDVDCADADCADDAACTGVDVEICDDGADNDGDGDVDCDDADCAGDAACIVGPDACEAPAAIAPGDVFTGSSLGGSDSYTASCGNTAGGPEVVYTYTPDADGEFCFTLAGTAYDGVLHVRADDCAAGEEIGCNDDDFTINDGDSLLNVDLVAGTTYYVFVDTYGTTGTGGDYQIGMVEGRCLPPNETSCTDGVDNDGDGDLDCADLDCAESTSCGEICDNGTNDDGDGFTDCFDSECTDAEYCGTFEWDCDNGEDEDGDTLIDCDDVDDCSEFITCLPETCDDGVDNNADGDVDCFDADCTEDPYCSSFEWNCEDGVDNDDDSFVDCDDDECGIAPGCFVAPSCDDATPIAIGDEFTGNLEGLTGAHTASCGFNAGGPEAVYVFSPGEDIDVCFSTGGSEFDTVLHIREATCADGTEIACNDDSSLVFGTRSTIDLEAVAGTTYYVFMDTYGTGTGGLFNFRAYDGPCVQEYENSCTDGEDNDGDADIDCADADCAGAFGCGEICDNGISDDGDGAVDCFDSECADTEYCGSFEWDCNDGDDEDGDELIDCADEDCVDAVFCQPETCDDGVDNDEDGRTDCFDEECAEDPYCSTFEWNCADGIDNDDDSFVDCDDTEECGDTPVCQAAAVCAAATPIDAAGTYSGDTTEGGNDFGSCGISEDANDIEFAFTPPTTGTWCIDTLGTSWDTVLYVWGTCGDPASEIACDDDTDFGDGLQSELQLELEAGVTYSVVVDGFAADSFGAFTLNVNEGECDGVP